ncbi:hypothetical protein HOE04_05510 [archaeon]|jgi:hypothetical protein|nr:hypothetical protein [archaeon]
MDYEVGEGLKKYYGDLVGILSSLDLERVDGVLDVLKKCKSERKTVYVCGNGESASTAEHYSENCFQFSDS